MKKMQLNDKKKSSSEAMDISELLKSREIENDGDLMKHIIAFSDQLIAGLTAMMGTEVYYHEVLNSGLNVLAFSACVDNNPIMHIKCSRIKEFRRIYVKELNWGRINKELILQFFELLLNIIVKADPDEFLFSVDSEQCKEIWEKLTLKPAISNLISTRRPSLVLVLARIRALRKGDIDIHLYRVHSHKGSVRIEASTMSEAALISERNGEIPTCIYLLE